MRKDIKKKTVLHIDEHVEMVSCIVLLSDFGYIYPQDWVHYTTTPTSIKNLRSNKCCGLDGVYLFCSSCM